MEKRLLDAVRAGVPVSDAAPMAGVHASTVYRWLERGEQEQQRIEAGQRARAGERQFREFRDRFMRARSEGKAKRVVDRRNILVAGGGTRNHVWSQATSDISGLTQTVREKTIGASYGDAFLAALAVGDVQREAIKRWNPVVSEVKPNPTLRDLYDRQHRIFHELYPRTKPLLG